jgi:hypothetical protein
LRLTSHSIAGDSTNDVQVCTRSLACMLASPVGLHEVQSGCLLVAQPTSSKHALSALREREREKGDFNKKRKFLNVLKIGTAELTSPTACGCRRRSMPNAQTAVGWGFFFDCFPSASAIAKVGEVFLRPNRPPSRHIRSNVRHYEREQL